MLSEYDVPLPPTVIFDHRSGLRITSLPLTQWARVRSPVGSVSCLRFFQNFFLNCKTNVRKFRLHSSGYHLTKHNLPKPYSSIYGRRQSRTLNVVGYMAVIIENDTILSSPHFPPSSSVFCPRAGPSLQSSGTKAAILPKGRSSIANSGT